MATTPKVQMDMAEFLANMAANPDPDLGPEDRENFTRNSVRAAYYACYHLALKWATWRGYEWPDSWGAHDGLWDCWFGQEPETRTIRRRGNALKSKRVDADYKIDVAFVLDAKEVLEEADELADLIRKDQERVYASPVEDQRVDWNRTAHPRPKRRR